MNQDYSLDIMLRKLDTKIKTLETNPNVTGAEVAKTVDFYKKLTKLGNYTQEQLVEFEDRLKVFAPNLSSSTIETTTNLEDEEIPKLSEISPKNYKMNKGKLIAAISGSVITIAIASVAGCTARKNNEVIEPQIVVENETQKIEPKEEKITKVLANNLMFDPNDNVELVNRMSDFIADALTKGIPVKDVMTEEELKLADENEEALVTIRQLMDFYMVMNIEDIDPVDYARLGYNAKTAETITDNYMYCARVFMTDALTADNNTKIDYSEIIADKDSHEMVQKFVDYLAEYNSSNDKKTVGSSIKEYINSNYINRDANLYSMSANEFTYRMMFVADMISNNTIIPKDVNVILNEDGKISCDIEKEDGVKDKTEKAEEFTSIYNTVDEKLEISREFINQDLTSISDDEKKTGFELEKEIKEQVLIKNISYKVNQKFKTSANSVKISPRKTTAKDSSYKTFTDKSTGKQVNVSNEELAKYNATNQAEYEAAKKAEFEENAKKDPNHTIKDTNGNTVATGEEADSKQFEIGYQDGYEDGNYYDGNYKQSSPKSNNKSYLAGYNEGFQKGRNDIINTLNSLKQPETTYEDTKDEVVDSNTTIVEEGYTGNITEPSIENSQPSEIIEEHPYVEEDNTFIEFEPIEEQNTESVEEQPEIIEETIEYVSEDNSSSVISETIEEFDYTASIKNLKSLREELLNMSNVYTEEVSKIRC